MFKQTVLKIAEEGHRWKIAQLMLTPGAVLFGTLEKAPRSGDCKGIKNLILIPFNVRAAFQVVVYAQSYLHLVFKDFIVGWRKGQR